MKVPEMELCDKSENGVAPCETYEVLTTDCCDDRVISVVNTEGDFIPVELFLGE